MSPAPELKATLTLPQTAFPMKANLPHNEPLRLARWKSMGLYEELRKARTGSPAYLLHDGPPYANGPIHLGHALNKGLKDFVVKSKSMAGFDAPYVPGFDCHGLPIEIKVDEKLGRKKLEMPAPAVLDACRAYAQKYVDLQTAQFERIGCLGRWQNPYKTMSRAYEARTLEAFYGFLEKGFVYRGLKPVYWCIHDRTALAEAEVEYENHTSPTVYVRYAMLDDGAVHDDTLKTLLAANQVYTIIWTTTPWTLPASLAVAFHPDFEYVALKQEGEVYIVAASLVDSVKSACKALKDAVEVARFKGSALENVHFQHPFLDRTILGVLATYVTADTGTGAVHTAPAHGADDFYTGQKYGLDPTCRVDASGHIHVDPAAWHQPQPPAYDGLGVWKANPVIVAMLEERGALMGGGPLEHSYPHCWRCHHPVIFRATEQWFISLETPMKRADGTETTYRQLSIEEIDKVLWDPAWGKERITNMIATRPDWCISRQRIWGVPIAVFMCDRCSQPVMDAALNKRIVELFDREGAEAWHTSLVESLLPAGTKCAHCGGESFRKETDILDVWFDSGVSWFAVCEADPELSPAYKSFESGTVSAPQSDGAEERVAHQGTTSTLHSEAAGNGALYQGVTSPNLEELQNGQEVSGHDFSRAENVLEKSGALAPATAPHSEPAAEGVLYQGTTSVVPQAAEKNEGALAPAPAKTEVLYLEGGDQHRGWFHSSLLTSVALRGRAPYSHVATAGWTLDESGRAMSKSLGIGVDPVDIADRMGGEIVRLWVASVDFREDMVGGESLMQRCAELYKKLRNTFRFLLGNLAGFDPERDQVAEAELLPLDRYMLARTRDLAEKILGWYKAFEFHRIYHAVNEFAIVDLSSFYLDVLKDRMYTFAPTSHERRSAQTVLWKVTEALVRLVAPIMSFTADEVWEYLPAVEGREASVHLALFPKLEEIFSEDPSAVMEEWKQLFEIRELVLLMLEQKRQAKEIGKGLEAKVEIVAAGSLFDLLQRHSSGLKELFNVSEVKLIDKVAIGDVVVVSLATGQKCARCWNFMPDVSDYGIWHDVCGRCQSALHEMGINPPQPQPTEAS